VATEKPDELGAGAAADLEFEVGDDPRPLVSDGQYEAACVGAEVVEFFKFGRSRKALLHFEIYSGPEQGKRLFLPMVAPRPGEKVRRGSKLYANYLVANGGVPPGRRDRISLKIFKRRLFRVMIKTVRPRFEDGSEKPELFHYSVVSELLERLT